MCERLVPVCGGFRPESVYVIVETPPSWSSLKLRLCPAAARTLAPCCTGPTGQKTSSDKSSCTAKRVNLTANLLWLYMHGGHLN